MHFQHSLMVIYIVDYYRLKSLTNFVYIVFDILQAHDILKGSL